ncbi:TPA: MarR family transcriptional regulator [Klebsiella aerogenes]|nr:MarR family transcriptional regulator [Klebsiella aerogenes]HBY9527206.1 MarR family transcriptional regulator [Klebsiella aerogenes]
MAKTLAQIKADYQYTDKKTGEVKDRTINTPHYFRDIPRIYSPNLQDGYMDFCPKAQKLYCYFQGWENSGNFCYESQEELGKVIDLSRERTCKLIKKLKDAGLITKEKNPGYRSKVYRTFPITDAHITPPEALTAQLVALSDEVPTQPEPEKAIAEDAAPDWDAWDVPENQSTPTIPTQQDKPELPWGGVAVCKPNGEPIDAALKWALTETMGDEEEAYQLISQTATKYLGREVIYTVPTKETFDDLEDIPF